MSSPASQVLRGAPTPCRPSGRTSLPSLGRTARGLAVRSQARGARLPGSWAWSPGCPTGILRGDDRASQVPGHPPCAHAPLSDPGGISVPGLSRHLDAAFRCCEGVGFHDFSTLGALSRSLRAPCVRFAAPVTRTPRNTRFRLVASLCRARLATRRDAQRVSEVTARASHPPSPGFAWRNTTLDNISTGHSLLQSSMA